MNAGRGASHVGAAVVVAVLASACHHDRAADSATIVRDSAGVTIVSSAAPLWAAGAEWRVADSAAVVIAFDDGARDGPTDVSDAMRLRDGRIAIVSPQAYRIEVYGTDARRVAVIGRKGQGPGEFRALDRIWRYRGDSLLAYEGGMTRRFSLFDSQGHFARGWVSMGADSTTHFLLPVGPLEDGEVLMRTMNVRVPTPNKHVDATLTHLYAFDAAWNSRAIPGGFPDSKFYLGPGHMIGELFFSTGTQFAVAGTRIYAGTSGGFEVRQLALDGSTGRLIRWSDTLAAVLDAHIEREKAGRIAFDRKLFDNAPALQAQYIDNGLIPLFAAMPMPRTFPAFSQLRTDGAGNLWVFDYPRIGEEATQPNAPAVFDSTGRWLGRVQLPRGFRTMDIGADYILGVRLDSLDVSRVELYALRKTRPD